MWPSLSYCCLATHSCTHNPPKKAAPGLSKINKGKSALMVSNFNSRVDILKFLMWLDLLTSCLSPPSPSPGLHTLNLLQLPLEAISLFFSFSVVTEFLLLHLRAIRVKRKDERDEWGRHLSALRSCCNLTCVFVLIGCPVTDKGQWNETIVIIYPAILK